LLLTGRVQGVGFRPWLYRLAHERGILGTIENSAEGVRCALEGERGALEALLRAIPVTLPPQAQLDRFEHGWQEPRGAARLEILASSDDGGRGARIPSDLATCAACARELLDPGDRRHRYPFTNCTDCGPRFTIVRALPYDRPKTSMAGFPLCAGCAREYGDPLDRRYHAEPVACPACGPRLVLRAADGRALGAGEEPVRAAGALLRAGRIIAVKGIGGFHLAADAENEHAVAELRRRKLREQKPFAVMVRDLEEARRHAHVSEEEAALLAAASAPIVLVARGATCGLAPAVAPGNPWLGLMLPYTPLHHLLLGELPALVMTSGNLSEEPIAIDGAEASARLGRIADAFLDHDREILVACDDSVLAVAEGGPLILRRSRGFVPDPIRLATPLGEALGVGAELKNTFCLTLGRDAYLGPHVGDLQNLESYTHFQRALAHLESLLRIHPAAVAHDLHPDYLTTRFAEELGLPRLAVQHHHAHLAAVVADRELALPVLGLALDGTGYGSDGTIWGGELLLLERQGGFERLGHLRPFVLPGGEVCIRSPRRTAYALLSSWLGREVAARGARWLDAPPEELAALEAMLSRRVSLTTTTSCGRLFDAVAALAGLGRRVSYEGQPALELEGLAWAGGRPLGEEAYPFLVVDGAELLLDPAPALAAILAAREAGVAVTRIAAGFHRGLARGLAELVSRATGRRGGCPVVLGGGCFQNRFLLGALTPELARRGLRWHLPQRVPPNDGGIALGQVAVLAARTGGQ
jgi:hydrogenase maturation protein HypF